MLHWNVVDSDVQGPGDGLQFAGLLSPVETHTHTHRKCSQILESVLPNVQKAAEASPPVLRHQLHDVIHRDLVALLFEER